MILDVAALLDDDTQIEVIEFERSACFSWAADPVEKLRSAGRALPDSAEVP